MKNYLAGLKMTIIIVCTMCSEFQCVFQERRQERGFLVGDLTKEKDSPGIILRHTGGGPLLPVAHFSLSSPTVCRVTFRVNSNRLLMVEIVYLC